MAIPQPQSVGIRTAKPEDAASAGKICYEAFRRINTEHSFPPDFPAVEAATNVLSMMFSHPHFYCVIAESDGRIVGSNCLDERGAIAGVGPITVDPALQNVGVGRMLMNAVLQRTRERQCAGVRLLQAAFHNRSLSLYTKLGFVVREPISVMQGPALRQEMERLPVRKATISDIARCNEIAVQVHGHDRAGELHDAIEQGTAVVVSQRGKITGYATALAFFGHAIAQSNQDLQALISSAESFGGPGILVPTRNAELFSWCLENGLRVVEPMTLMTIGLYNEPAGAWLPSILF
ncbi:MAG TPA: GNAT family N-acetyltransferase [Bryobacteraceae bacterium]|jgi:GNAT superfamily N-acetyltransferase|nr:GNAT family N-acetyltransferase [Bryobacteraceae bacterium]